MNGEKFIDGAKMTFDDLADYYEGMYLIEPQYVQGRKVAGLRDYKNQKRLLKTLRDSFGSRKIQSITTGQIERFKTTRLSTPTSKGGQRAIASVNRELALLRRMLRVAQAEGWIIRNPFVAAKSLISLADEKKRERIITREEEERLLDACSGRRAHIRPIVVMALDTGMRRGEMLKLKWESIDFDNRLIRVEAFNTKTMQERWLALTPRLERELLALYNKSTKDPNELVFGILDNVKNAYMSARKLAGLPDVRFHDLRHTAATRLVEKIPLPLVGRILGHTQANTTMRYVNANLETARRAADVWASYGEDRKQEAQLIN